MSEPTKQHDEKVKVLKKLIKQWMNVQDTQDKAHVVLSRNPHIKKSRKWGKAS
ncbi:MAG TPA: hypothetical protein VHE54_05510 [Puia sp.]|nr:hypothetical protein [Puia sp.]